MFDTLLKCLIFAESKAMPIEKKIGIIVLFGALGVISTMGLFASSSKLEKMAGLIGTKNPIVARMVCVLGALVGLGAVALVASTFVTHWDD